MNYIFYQKKLLPIIYKHSYFITSNYITSTKKNIIGWCIDCNLYRWHFYNPNKGLVKNYIKIERKKLKSIKIWYLEMMDVRSAYTYILSKYHSLLFKYGAWLPSRYILSENKNIMQQFFLPVKTFFPFISMIFSNKK